ncbi:hypothetical protein IAQ61_003620 [Plenodomus lingam]|uniref:Predicted protein n=1 Tax=Leptosphaeria maculans (strain JN3 / isolate v23.1.3 / race Av1-4-5-6-7-8) TaxID=985895 RepID=E4ZR68_LEPMJ|nr:predicted protein [Plenodomus lingam JN3]KAH9874431.1 hypothetical protein IAQ61_003620 [Plenodomus lingam]CBX93733.1 predicted protein [Plenodomus lingam JN3]
MDPFGLFADFIEELSQTNAVEQSRPTVPVGEQDPLASGLALSTRTSEKGDCAIQLINPVNENIQASHTQHSSTVAPSPNTHTPMYMNPSSTTRTWLDMDPISHGTSDITFDSGFTTLSQYQNSTIQQDPMTFTYHPALDNLHQHYHSGQTPPWTAYQSFAYMPPDLHYLQDHGQPLTQSHQPNQFSGHLPDASELVYDYQCQDPLCNCQYFHPPIPYATNNETAMRFKDEWTTHGPLYQSRPTERH